MDIAVFGWTVVASIIGTIVGIVAFMVFDKAYPGVFN